MEIQLEQLILFESGETLFSSVKSKGCVCISTEREVKVKYDHRSKFSNLSNWKEEA